MPLAAPKCSKVSQLKPNYQRETDVQRKEPKNDSRAPRNERHKHHRSPSKNDPQNKARRISTDSRRNRNRSPYNHHHSSHYSSSSNTVRKSIFTKSHRSASHRKIPTTKARHPSPVKSCRHGRECRTQRCKFHHPNRGERSI